MPPRRVKGQQKQLVELTSTEGETTGDSETNSTDIDPNIMTDDGVTNEVDSLDIYNFTDGESSPKKVSGRPITSKLSLSARRLRAQDLEKIDFQELHNDMQEMQNCTIRVTLKDPHALTDTMAARLPDLCPGPKKIFLSYFYFIQFKTAAACHSYANVSLKSNGALSIIFFSDEQPVSLY